MVGDRTVLALDLGQDCGWAFGKNGVIEASGTATFKKANTHPGYEFAKFREFLHDFRSVDMILYERVSGFKGAGAAMNYGAYKSQLMVFSYTHTIKMQNMKPGDIKRLFTGNGNAPKEEMCRVAHKLGWSGGMPGTRIDHDECDALALLWCVYHEHGIQPRLKSRERIIPSVAKLHVANAPTSGA